jgi:UPF0755 protein
MKKNLALIIPATLAISITIYLVIILTLVIYFNAPNFYHKQDKKFIIESGLTLRQVVNKLYEEQIIEHPRAFLIIGQMIKGIDSKVRYGEYFLEKNLSYSKILHKMIRGNISFRKITIAEGLSSHSAMQIIANAPGLIGNTPEKILEGSILPETYFYSYNDTRVGIIQRMQSSMQKSINELWKNRDQSIPIATKEQAIVLASIIEKETGLKSEVGNIASVFINRLKKGMKLQSDPTIIYSFAFGNKSLERSIKVSDIQNNSIFNTYNIYGLPPTPICNPSLVSIKAVLNPPTTDYLFFVANPKGSGHLFAKTLEEHNQNVAKYRYALKEQKAKLTQDATQSKNTVNLEIQEQQ